MRVQTDMIYRLHLCVSKCKSGVCYMNHVSICECSMCDCVHTHPQRKFCVACTYLLHSRQTCLMFQSPPTTFPYHSQDIPQMLIQSSRSVSTHPQNMFCVMCVFLHFITVARQTNAVKMICPQRRESTSCWTPHWLNEKSVIIHKLNPSTTPMDTTE